MRRGLRLRLALTHALVAIVAIAVVAVIVNVTGGRRFEQYLADVQQRRDQAVVEALTETYQPGTGWDAKAVYALSQATMTSGVNVAVYDPDGSLLFTVQGIRRGMMGGTDMMQGDGGMEQGAQGTLAGTGFTVSRYPVVVDGERVASADIFSRRSARVAAEQAYESSLTRNLVIAGVLAGVLALLISVLVSRRITGPLEELTDAAADVTAGNLDVRVAPRGDDEVAALASAFNMMADSLARDEQWRRDMTADLSHELRTPLATIQSRIEALEDGVLPATPENLRVIGDEVERLGRLLGELHSLNELESEDFDVVFQPLDLGDVGRDALARVEPLAKRRSIRLEDRLAPATVDGDRDQLLQVAGNLLDNAFKFTPEGGSVTLGVADAPPPPGRGGPWAALTVVDTGSGIDPVDLPFVFDRFYRSRSVRHAGRRPRSRDRQGAGRGPPRCDRGMQWRRWRRRLHRPPAAERLKAGRAGAAQPPPPVPAEVHMHMRAVQSDAPRHSTIGGSRGSVQAPAREGRPGAWIRQGGGMRHHFKGKDFLKLADFTPEEIGYLVDTAMELKRKRAAGEVFEPLRGKTFAMIFEKLSTRTRVSFQAGAAQLGAQTFYMSPDQMQTARGEPIRDTARIVDRYCDGLFIRTFGQEIAEEYAQYMRNPVINALTNETHPCQGLCDLMTIKEKKGAYKGLKVGYLGDIWNVCHSLMMGSAMTGMDFYAAQPSEDYQPLAEQLRIAQEWAALSGSTIVFTKDLEEVATDADVIYGNTWHSMATENLEQRLVDFRPYQVNMRVIEMAKPDVIYMHCLPGTRGEDMVDEVIESKYCVFWDQGENRMHTEKAILALTTF